MHSVLDIVAPDNPNYIFIDFEFSNSNEEVLKLTSCSWQINREHPQQVWLYNKPNTQKKLAEYFLKYRDSHIFVSYAATAEARSFLSLGLNPLEFKWIDLFFEQRQLTHTLPSCKYGRYVTKTGMWRFSCPPSYDPEKNIGKDNNPVGIGYVDAVANHLGLYVDSVHKREMRDLILAQLPEYTLEQQKQIMDYCSEDIRHLPDLLTVMTDKLRRAIECPLPEVRKFQLIRGNYAACLAHMESIGFPIRVDWVRNLRRNFETAKDTLISELVTKHYPFYVKEKKRKNDLSGKWTLKYDMIEKFINEHPHIPWSDQHGIKKWELSQKTGKYKTDEATLEKFDGIPEIKALRQTNKIIGQLKWFQEPKAGKDDERDFFDNVGSDNKLRAYQGGYGTQTGRNSPKAKTFVLSMSSWLRCLIQTIGDEAIVGIDWSSQEFIIGAALSGDKNMLDAYASGDPYLYFAKKAGAVPDSANNKWCKSPDLAPENEREQYEKYKEARNLFKATVLGLQYGMSYEKLSVKLTSDCGRDVSIEEAKQLQDLHKDIFSTYWRWLQKNIVDVYKRNKYLILSDGWALLDGQDNDLSTKNFPIQGSGGVIMRIACDLFLRRGGRPMAPQHDAIYARFNTKTEAHHPELLAKCMQDAVEAVLGDIVIRQDSKILTSDEVWIEDKGERYYHMLKQYLEPIFTMKDRISRSHKKVFKIDTEIIEEVEDNDDA